MMKSVSSYVIDFLRTFTDESGANVDAIFTDILEGEPTNMAVASSSSNVLKRYFYGKRQCEKNFTIYLSEYSGSNVERKQNTAFVEKLEYWVNEKNAKREYPELGKNRKCFFIEAANGSLYETDKDNTGIYMLQIKVVYTERSI